jgi:AcrR family transcriptional regulator
MPPTNYPARNTAKETDEPPLVPAGAKDRDLVERKQAQIAQGACRVFFDKGFHRTTIREIALACGMSMGQLYHYISCKDDVLFLVYQHMQGLWRRHLEAVGLEEIAEPECRLARALASTLEFMDQHHDLFLFVYTETKYLERRHLEAVLASDDQGVVGFWRKLLAQARPCLDPELAANLISFLMVFPVLRGWNLDPARRGEHLEQTVEFILRGLGLPARQGGDDHDGGSVPT